MAKKIHQQLTDIILELASPTCTFDKIGTLKRDSQGNFHVGPYVDPNGTAYPRVKASIYRSMDAKYHGPFCTISDFYRGMSQLNIRYALEDPEEEDRDVAVAEYKLLQEMSPKFIIEAFDKGPFVINHNDLTIQNILVDNDFNITGILDFPGTIVPLPSLCVFPWLFKDNVEGLVADRNAYLDDFLIDPPGYLLQGLYPI